MKCFLLEFYQIDSETAAFSGFIFLSASSKTISGLLEFDSKTEAVEALTVLNHYQIRIPSKSDHLLNLQHTFGPKTPIINNK